VPEKALLRGIVPAVALSGHGLNKGFIPELLNTEQ
jgi:hypothetical protein